MNRTTLTDTERCALIERVADKAHDETESWRSEDHLGCDLAYLFWAIAAGSTVGCEPDSPMLVLFREWFAPEDVIWSFIETLDL